MGALILIKQQFRGLHRGLRSGDLWTVGTVKDPRASPTEPGVARNSPGVIFKNSMEERRRSHIQDLVKRNSFKAVCRRFS
jgi:hypothetical protein